jgi:hypothetical protein
MNYLPNVGPYTYISRNEVLEHSGRKFRIVLYGAYNAKGLIGSECNGICILDDDLLNVVLDEHGKEETGYFGPSEQQLEVDPILWTKNGPSLATLCRASRPPAFRCSCLRRTLFGIVNAPGETEVGSAGEHPTKG